jgi:hypothetical protein
MDGAHCQFLSLVSNALTNIKLPGALDMHTLDIQHTHSIHTAGTKMIPRSQNAVKTTGNKTAAGL